MFIDIVFIVIEVVLSILLYKLSCLNPIKKLSFAASTFRFAVILVIVINVVFLSIAFINQLMRADVWSDGHQRSVYAWQLCFSIHVFLLGMMVLKNNVARWKYLGAALLLGAFGDAIDAFRALTEIDHSVLTTVLNVLLIFITVSEIGMAVGLIMNKIIIPISL